MNDFKDFENYDEAVVYAMSCPFYENGDIVLVDLGCIQGDCLVRKVRPAIIISSTRYNSFSPVMQIVPMSKKFKNMDADYHVFIDKDECVDLNSSGMAMVEQITTIDRTKVVHYIGYIADEHLLFKLHKAIANQLELEEF